MLREPEYKERFWIELRNKFAVLEGMNDEESADSIWDRFN